MRLTKAIDDALAPFAIDVREFTVLTLLATEGPGSQKRISDRLRVDRTTMVALIDELEVKGLCLRERDMADRRSYQVRITAEGGSLVEDALPAVRAAEADVLAALSPDERNTLTGLLVRASSP